MELDTKPQSLLTQPVRVASVIPQLSADFYYRPYDIQSIYGMTMEVGSNYIYIAAFYV